MMRAIVAAPALPPTALADLKDWLGITTGSEDEGLLSLLRVALEACEAFTGTIPIECTAEEVLPVAGDWQRLQTMPVHSITQVEGINAAGTRLALSPADYAIDFDADGRGRIRIVNPGLAQRVVVRFVAGLAPDWSGLPDGLRHGVIRLAANNYRQRETGGGDPVPPAAVAALWRPWRRLRFA